MTTLNGDTTTPPLTTATPLIEETLVRDEQTNEVYLPLTATVVLKRKQEMLYVSLDFESNLTEMPWWTQEHLLVQLPRMTWTQ